MLNQVDAMGAAAFLQGLGLGGSIFRHPVGEGLVAWCYFLLGRFNCISMTCAAEDFDLLVSMMVSVRVTPYMMAVNKIFASLS